MSKRILVTGGAGFIGRHLVDWLLHDGHEVTVMDSLVDQVHHGKIPQFPKEVSFVKANVNSNLVGSLIEDKDVVFHLAAEVGIGQSMYEINRYVRENIQGTANLMEHVIKSNVKKVIVAGSVSSYGESGYQCCDESCEIIFYPEPRTEIFDNNFNYYCPSCMEIAKPIPMKESDPIRPASIYGITKKAQEDIVLTSCKAYGIQGISLRYFNVIGTGQDINNPYTGVIANFYNRLKNKQRPIVYEDGSQLRDFVSVNDIVSANLLALENDDAIGYFNIGTGSGSSISIVANKMAHLMNIERLAPEITYKFRSGDTRHIIADISKAKKVLDYSPKLILDDMLSQYILWANNQEANKYDETDFKNMEEKGLLK